MAAVALGARVARQVGKRGALGQFGGQFGLEAGAAIAEQAVGAIGARRSVDVAAGLAIGAQHRARGIALHVARHGDAAAFEFADPVRRQRAFVELGELLHVFAARADQQAVDAGPDGRAVALAARLRRRWPA